MRTRDDGYRQRPDGQTLAFTITYTEALGNMNPDEVQVVMTLLGRRLASRSTRKCSSVHSMEERNRAGDIEVGVWYVDRSTVVMVRSAPLPGSDRRRPWCPSYAIYMADIVYGSGTTSRPFVLEPPADHPVRKMARTLASDGAESQTKPPVMPCSRKCSTFHIEHPYMIGTVGEDPAPVIVKNNIVNVGSGFINDDTMRNEGIARPKQMFIRS